MTPVLKCIAEGCDQIYLSIGAALLHQDATKLKGHTFMVVVTE